MKTKNVLVFAGTSEGREICEFLVKHQIPTTACVATEYGSECLDEIMGIEVLEGRLDLEEMRNLVKSYDYIVDATHPYATIVSENIRKACGKEINLIRVIRDSQKVEGLVFDGFSSLCEYLNQEDGVVLVTTGSKDLAQFRQVKEFESRIYPRILPSIESLDYALKQEIKSSHIICMQGPFSVEMNVATMKQIGAKFMVTKDTGKNGGYEEKVQAAKLAGATLLTIGRPVLETGIQIEEAKEYLYENIVGSRSRNGKSSNDDARSKNETSRM